MFSFFRYGFNRGDTHFSHRSFRQNTQRAYFSWKRMQVQSCVFVVFWWPGVHAQTWCSIQKDRQSSRSSKNILLARWQHKAELEHAWLRGSHILRHCNVCLKCKNQVKIKRNRIKTTSTVQITCTINSEFESCKTVWRIEVIYIFC